MLKRIALILAAVVAGFLGAVAVTGPAHADPTCPFQDICWFDANNWQGTKYVVDPSSFPANHCFNMGVDPNTGINWNDIVGSVWWNDIQDSHTYVEFYENVNCTGISITRAHAWVPTSDQMQSCVEAVNIWNGPCVGRPGTPKLISSWAFTF